MTVRWKPLIVLSGLFFVVAVAGLLVVTLDLAPGRPDEILAQARRERQDGRFGNAQIHYLRALQLDPKGAAIYAEVAEMYAEWAAKEPSKAPQLRFERLSALANAAKYGQDPAPRRALLAEAQSHEDDVQVVLWAKKLLDLDAQDPDAHYALAVAALEGNPPEPVQAQARLDTIAKSQPNRPRTAYLRAALAEQRGDAVNRDAALASVRELSLEANADDSDRRALLMLARLDAIATSDPAVLPGRIAAVRRRAEAAASDPRTSPERLVHIARLLEQVQRHAEKIAARNASGKDALVKATAELEGVAEASFSAARKQAGSSDLGIAEDYAEHLLFRGERERCLALVEQTLKLPAASLPVWGETVTRLHEIAIKAALEDDGDPQRFSRAEPHIQALLASPVAVHQAVGHLFQGVVDLDRSGLTAAAQAGDAAMPTTDPKLRASALAHLKDAAAGLPKLATAQALYGVALLLSDEPALGRQYLLAAQRSPDLEPRYRLWAAWAMLQAGYPEEAGPIVEELIAGIGQGTVDPELEPTLRLLSAEVHQASRSPEGLKKARAEYQQALAAAGADKPSLLLRQARIDVMLGEPQSALKRIEQLRSKGKGGPAAESLAVMILSDQGREAEARQVLAKARKAFPDAGELAGVDAALWLKQDKPDEADRVLAEFLKTHPRDLTVVQMRARLLAETLKKTDEARSLLDEAASWADTSAPLVQRVLVDLNAGDEKAAAATIAKIRARWKEAAAADLLDAQLALTRKDLRAARSFLDEALKKDPSNKLALFWKAQLEDRAGSSGEAAKIYESLVRENPVKELDDGLTLATAANWALAAMDLQKQQVDSAITRLEDLLRGGVSGEMSRPVRWQLVAARVAKGQWPVARAEVEALLKDGATTAEERIRAANFYRLNGEPRRALELLDEVLKSSPDETSALAMKAYMMAESQPAAAAALLRGAIDRGKQPASIYLMLAALENMTPSADGLARARAVVEQGLKAHPDAIELIQARYRVMRLSGDAKAALGYVEGLAANDPGGQVRRFLVDIYRDQAQYEKAEAVLRKLIEQEPDDEALPVMLVRILAFRAFEASGRGDDRTAEGLHRELDEMLARYRERFPHNLSFAQAQAELAIRRGQADRARDISREIDKIDGSSPIGPVLRAQLAAGRGWSEGVVQEYSEAVTRAPQRHDLRLALAQAQLAAGKADDALRQANWLVEQEGSPEALLLKARALVSQGTTPARQKAQRDAAIALLRANLKAMAKVPAVHHLLAEFQAEGGDRAGAIATLKADLAAMPQDAAGLAQLVQLLCEPGTRGQPAAVADLAEADRLVNALAEKDSSGNMALAASIGYHKAGQIERAIPWAERAVEKLDTPIAHLNLADLRLAAAEAQPDPARAKPLFEEALAEYDRVLERQADSIEAVNNKAWILHHHLGRHAEALALAEGLMKRVDAGVLPADFFDTLGSIQEAMKRPREAEESYQKGLRKAPEHPILNYHLGRLLANDPARSSGAGSHLQKAQEQREQLPPSMASDVDALIARVRR